MLTIIISIALALWTAAAIGAALWGFWAAVAKLLFGRY